VVLVATRTVLLLPVLALLGLACSPDDEARIARIEAGLIREYGDPPRKRMGLAERMRHHRVPGASIAVVDDLEIAWAKGYGVLESGSAEPVTTGTLFQAASIGKVVVAVAALHQVERGTLDLDEDVNRRLTSWKVPGNEFTAKAPVTLRRLLSHTAGVTVHGFRGYAPGEARPDLRQVLDGAPPANSPPIRVDTVPGTRFRYSGGGYQIVQQLLEDVTGRSFPVLLRETVLEPWGMTATTFESPLPERLRPIAARGYRADGRPVPGGWHTYPEMGAGGSIWSTPSDLARFLVGTMRARRGECDAVLGRGMATEMLTAQTGGRGLGPFLGDDGGDRVYFMHDGGNEGYRCVAVAYPERGQGVVIMTSGDGGKALWQEILNAVSVEYGWVVDRTWIGSIALAVALLLAAGGLILWRRRRTRTTP
jgi:CubicO group peptidase (beta-lactamase class C family)